MKRTLPILVMLSLGLVISCSREEPASPPAMDSTHAAASEAAPQREPTPALLTPAAREWVLQTGKKVAAETFGLLSSNLQQALATGGVTNALPYCSLAASPLTASVGERHGVEVRRVTHKARNLKAAATEFELLMLDQFRDALVRSNAPSPLITNLHDGTLVFYAPIILTNALCLKCHGQPGSDIAPEALQVIRRLYPADQAVGFGLGELRGAWRVEFPANTVERHPAAAGPKRL
jgi:hypothetical protein